MPDQFGYPNFEDLHDLPTPYVVINCFLFQGQMGIIRDKAIDRQNQIWYKVRFEKGYGWFLRRMFDFKTCPGISIFAMPKGRSWNTVNL